MAQEKELGRGRVGCGVRRDWDWGLETGSFPTLVGISELLRDQNGYLKMIAQSLVGGLGSL